MKVDLAPSEFEALQSILNHQNARISISLNHKRRKLYLDATLNNLAIYEKYCEDFLFQTEFHQTDQLTAQGQIVSGLLKKLRQCILFADDD